MESPMSATDKSPLRSTYEPICWNFKLLAQHELQGFGGMGEGMAVQIAPDGRRIIWLAHESAPKNFTAVDVSDPRKPQEPAGFELFDISKPENPKSIAFVDCSGPHSRGVHQLWFCDGEYVHMAAGAGDFVTHNQLDDQCYQIFDVRNPSAPKEVGRWWMPGTRVGDAAPQPVRHKAPLLDMGMRAQN